MLFRSVAPSGLEGLSQTYAITREIAPLIGSVTATDRGRQQFEWETDGRGEPVFRLQLYAKANDAVPIIDETGLTTYSMSVDGLTAGSYTWRIGMRRVTDGVMNEFWTDPVTLTISAKAR